MKPSYHISTRTSAPRCILCSN